MYCPECGTELDSDVEDWIRSKGKKYWVCPYCAWYDKDMKLPPEKFGDSRFLKYARKVA